MIPHYRVTRYASCFRKKKSKEKIFLSKSMPNFNFAELIKKADIRTLEPVQLHNHASTPLVYQNHQPNALISNNFSQLN